MVTLHHPGVYQEELRPAPPPLFRTAVTAFLGEMPDNGLQPVTRFSQFQRLAVGNAGPFLQAAVRGFFDNGGELCFVVPASFPQAFEALEVTGCDLVCWPELMQRPQNAVQTQQMLLDHCDRSGDRMAIFDPLPDETLQDAVTQWSELHGVNGAIYFPWVLVRSGPPGQLVAVPPCGHIAGVYARIDRQFGVFDAPANVDLEGVQDLQTALSDASQDLGDPHNVINCLRAFPGRGIRVWGARTVSGQINWRYVSVRRLFITLRRWINTNMAHLALETNDHRLWARMRRQLNTYLESLFRAGALKGTSPQEGFYIRCDATNNTAADREAGRVNVEIGLAPAVPAEFIVARLVLGPDGEVQEPIQKE